MSTIQATIGQAGSFDFQTKNAFGALISPVSTPSVKWYTDTDRTLNELAITVTGSGSDWTASWTAPQAPVTTASRYLKVRIETATGVFAPDDADDQIDFGTAVADPNTWPVTVQMVKDRLDKTLTVDDAEIEDMLEAALAEYAEWVGPWSGAVTEKLDGGGTNLVLRNPAVASITAASYSDGTVIDLADLDLDTSTGIVYWGYGTAGRFTAGARNVLVTYEVGLVPANHRETIAADVAGYFALTQREGIPGEGYEQAQASTPLVLFPRIRKLTAPSIA